MYLQGLRQYVGHQKLLSPSICAVIENAAGAILLHRRATGAWSLPAGGVELDESIFEALQREVREETAIAVVRATPFGIYSDPKYSVTYPHGDQVQYVDIAFYVEEWTGQPVPDGAEAVALAFFDPDQLPVDTLFPTHTRKIIAYFCRYRRTRGSFVVD